MWIAQGCSLQDDAKNPGLTGRMESVLTPFFGDRIQLAVAYMADGKHSQKMRRGGIEYYSVDADLRVGITDRDWERAREQLLCVIRDFCPDLIQCFGSEWPYGMIAEVVNIPVEVHLMGFLNIYYLSIHMARGDIWKKQSAVRKKPLEAWPEKPHSPVKPQQMQEIQVNKETIGEAIEESIGKTIEETTREAIGETVEETVEDRCRRFERRVMAASRFFFGRTQWDRNIARYYSPGSRYFHVPEVIKPSIYKALGQWKYQQRSRLRLFSLSSGDDRKGNEIILRTAEILKYLLGLDLEWRVAGSRDFIPYYEQRTGIMHEDVGIELLGMIGSEEIIEEMRSADLFVHPSIMDNSPNTVCEAQLIGCPVIASNVGGLPDLVENGKTGFLYPYNEPHTLAFMIANLRGDKKLLSEISKNEVTEARRRHDPQMIAEVMFRAYETIVKNPEMDDKDPEILERFFNFNKSSVRRLKRSQKTR